MAGAAEASGPLVGVALRLGVPGKGLPAQPTSHLPSAPVQHRVLIEESGS